MTRSSLLAIILHAPFLALTGATDASSPSPGPLPIETPLPSPGPTLGEASLTVRELPEIHASIALPGEWTLIPGTLLDGGVLLATREHINGEQDPWNMGLSMSIDRTGAKESGQKARAYALGLAREAREKAGEEASPLAEADAGGFHEVRFAFPVSGDPSLLITEVLRSNDATGTVVTIVWQMPAEEASGQKVLRDAILSRITLDPGL